LTSAHDELHDLILGQRLFRHCEGRRG
jgi:hypothetical protein